LSFRSEEPDEHRQSGCSVAPASGRGAIGATAATAAATAKGLSGTTIATGARERTRATASAAAGFKPGCREAMREVGRTVAPRLHATVQNVDAELPRKVSRSAGAFDLNI